MKRNTAKKPLHDLVKLALATGLCSVSSFAVAANWTLADYPLYLGSSVPANILLMTDDSGSMDWDVMTRDYVNDGRLKYPQPDGSATPTGGGIKNRAGCAAPYEYAVQFNSTSTCDVADDLEWRFRNADFNPMYFNPKKQYKPWSGTDKNGIAFGNIDPAQAWDDPYVKNYSGTGSWINVTNRASAISIVDNVALAQKPLGAGALALNGPLTSGGTLTLAAADKLKIASTGNISSRTFTITGTSASGSAQNETITGPNNSTVTSTKTWKTVTSITINGSALANITVGTNATPASGDNHPILAGGLHFSTWTDSATNPTFFDNGEQTDYQVGNLPAVIPAGWDVSYDADPKKAVQINFANWLSYYRARHLVAKSALGSLVANANNLRMGFATLHNNGTINTPMSQVDATPAGVVNRKTLLDNIYKNFPANGTPLRAGLRKAGEYLSGNTSAIAFASPAAAPLPLASGGACQQNFTLLMTDGFYNDTTTEYSSTMSGTIGNADGDKNTNFDNKLYPNYGDLVTRTLADVAMYYYERDIIPTVANNVPVIAGVDNATHQHMVTFSVAFGLNGNLKGMPEDYTAHVVSATCNAACAAAWNGGVFPGWPTASSNNADNFTDKQRIDDLRHAAYNGRGEFIEANNPDTLADGLTSMINSIQGRIAASAALAFNSTSLHSNSLVFQARYDTTDWTGELRYLPLNSSGDLTAAVANTGTKLKGIDPATRNIITMDPVARVGIPFQWASLPAAQKTALVSQQILDYVRGEQACEIDYVGLRPACSGTKNLRNRSRPLGDIINSTPVYVSTPDPSSVWTTSDASYLTHISTMSTRIPMVYTGANDGMLHGFNAQVDSAGGALTDTGKELIAYVPSVVYGNLPNLANISYTHKYYVDGSPTVGDAKFGSSWHTVLVGGLRAGGQAMFALDITNPGSFSESNAATLALWEFTDNGSGAVGSFGDADLGYTFSEPAIAKMADGNWAAVFGNGYNNTVADGRASTTGNAVLYVVNLQTGALLRKIDTGKGRSADPECVGTAVFCSTNGRPNGLAGARAIDVDADGVADFVYAGDLFGNLWRFDVTSGTATSWNVSFAGKPLFTTASVDVPSKMQSITVRPTVGAHANGISAGYMVYFGTGKYIEFADNTSLGQPTQTFYAVWDKWPKVSPPAFTAITRTNLVSQTILQETADNMRITSNSNIDWTTKQGWYMDLVVQGAVSNNGERVITEALLRGGNILFSTFVPSSAICEYGGSGYLMIVDAFTGSRTYLPPLDINGDTLFNDADKVLYGGVLVAVSGYKSVHGVPSAASLMESSGGTSDILLMNFADGSAGGIVDHSATDPALRITPSDNYSSGSTKGRVSWQRLK